MKLCELLENERVFSFSRIPMSKCRVTKERLLGGAPSISMLNAVILCVMYPTPRELGGRTHDGDIAAFSKIRDYHAYFASLEKKIKRELEARRPGRYVRVFSDHSPIDERRAAVEAGLGVIGENGLFISESGGSYVFLGEIVTSLSDSELSDEGIPRLEKKPRGCVKCGRCRAACPAGCIGDDGESKKTTCVSALTQKKGELSKEERERIIKSGFAWGCDICAEVCPMNGAGQKKRVYPAYFDKARILGRSAAEIMSEISKMDESTYATYPFSWRKREVLERNFMLFADLAVYDIQGSETKNDDKDDKDDEDNKNG